MAARSDGIGSIGLVVLLAERVMGWTVAPDRFLIGGRRWLPRWRFRPDQKLSDAFRLLEEVKPERYAMGSDESCEFWVRVEIKGRIGEASNISKPKAITFAVALAVGIQPEADR